MHRINRRHFLAQASLASVAGCSSLTSSRQGYIDAHSHIWTPDTKSYPLAPGFTKAYMKPASFTPEQLSAHCKRRGRQPRRAHSDELLQHGQPLHARHDRPASWRLLMPGE